MRYHKVVAKGIACYDQALKLKPNDPQTWEHRGTAFAYWSESLSNQGLAHSTGIYNPLSGIKRSQKI